MKKRYMNSRKTIAFLMTAVMLVVALLTGCNPEQLEPRGILSVDVGKKITRSAYPVESMEVSRYVLHFTPLEGQPAKADITISSESGHVEEPMDAGRWNIRCEAQNIMNRTLGFQEKQINVVAGSTVSVRFMISETEGDGFFSVELLTQLEGWKFRISDIDGKLVEELDVVPASKASTMVVTRALHNGIYQTELISPEGESLWTDSFRIAAGHGTACKYEINLENYQISGDKVYDIIYQGTTENVAREDPVPLTLKHGGNVAMNCPTEFTLEIADRTPSKVEWFIDGIYQEGKSGLAVELTVPEGRHTVSAVTLFTNEWSTASYATFDTVPRRTLKLGAESVLTDDIDWAALERGFEKAHPEIDLVVERISDGMSTWPGLIIAGNGPDLIVAPSSAYVDELIRLGHVRPFSDTLLSSGLWGDGTFKLRDSVMLPSSANGPVYVVPFLKHMEKAVFYNRDSFLKSNSSSSSLPSLPVSGFFQGEKPSAEAEFITYYEDRDLEGLLGGIIMNIYGYHYESGSIYSYSPVWNQGSSLFAEKLRATSPSTLTTAGERLDAFLNGRYSFIVGSPSMMNANSDFNWGMMPYCGKNADTVDVSIFMTAGENSASDAEKFLLWLYSDSGIRSVESGRRFSYIMSRRFTEALQNTDMLSSRLESVSPEGIVDFPENFFNPKAAEYAAFIEENNSSLKLLVDGKTTATAWIDDMMLRTRSMASSFVDFSIVIDNDSEIVSGIVAHTAYADNVTYEWFIDDVKIPGQSSNYLKGVGVSDLVPGEHVLSVVVTDQIGKTYRNTAIFTKMPYLNINVSNYSPKSKSFKVYSDIKDPTGVTYDWYIASEGTEPVQIEGEHSDSIVLDYAVRQDPLISVICKVHLNGREYPVSTEYFDIGNFRIKGLARPSEGNAELSAWGAIVDGYSDSLSYSWDVKRLNADHTEDTLAYSTPAVSIPITVDNESLYGSVTITLTRNAKTYTGVYDFQIGVGEYELGLTGEFDNTAWDVPMRIRVDSDVTDPVWTLDGQVIDTTGCINDGYLEITPHAGRHTISWTATGFAGEALRSPTVTFMRYERYAVLQNLNDMYRPTLSAYLELDPTLPPIAESDLRYEWVITRRSPQGYVECQRADTKQVVIQPALGYSDHYRMTLKVTTTDTERALSYNAPYEVHVPFFTRITGIHDIEIPAGTVQQRTLRLESTYRENGVDMPYIDFSHITPVWTVDGIEMQAERGKDELVLDISPAMNGSSVIVSGGYDIEDIYGNFSITEITTAIQPLIDDTPADRIFFGKDKIRFKLIGGPTDVISSEVHLVANGEDRIVSENLDSFSIVFDENNVGKPGTYTMYAKVWNGEYMFESEHLDLNVEEASRTVSVILDNQIEPLEGNSWLTPVSYAFDGKCGDIALDRITVTDISHPVELEGIPYGMTFTFKVSAFNSENAVIGTGEFTLLPEETDDYVNVIECEGTGTVNIRLIGTSETSVPVVRKGRDNIPMTWTGDAWTGSFTSVNGISSFTVEVDGVTRNLLVRVVSGRNTDIQVSCADGSVKVGINNQIKLTPKMTITELSTTENNSIRLRASITGYDSAVDYKWMFLDQVKHGEETIWQIPDGVHAGYLYVNVIARCGELNVSESYEIYVP